MRLAFLITLLSVPTLSLYPSPYSASLLRPFTVPGTTSRGEPTFAGAVPLGNGDVAVTLWVNASAGSVEAYVRKADAQGSAADEMVIALVRFALAPNPFLLPNGTLAAFNQTLDLATATVTIFAGGAATPNDNAARVDARVDANAHVLVIEAAAGATASPLALTFELVSVRPPARAAYGVSWSCFGASSAPDVAVDPLPAGFADGATIALFHRNDAAQDVDARLAVLAQQNISDLGALAPDPWTNRTFGVAADAGGGAPLVRAAPGALVSRAPSSAVRVRVVVVSEQAPSADDFLKSLAAAAAVPLPDVAAHNLWWAGYWSRSRIEVDTGDAPAPSPTPPPPSPLPPVLLRFSAAALAAAGTPAGPLAVWPDASGAGLDATQAVDAARPSFAPAEGGTPAAVIFSAAAGTFLENAAFAMPSGGATVLAVFSDNGSPSTCCSGLFYARGSCRGLSTARAGAGVRVMADWCYSLDTTASLDVRGARIVAAVVYGVSPIGPANSSAAVYVNGCAQQAFAAIPGVAGAGGFSVGTRGGIDGRFFEGALHELVVLGGALDAAGVASASAALAATWNVAPLPAACPPGPAAVGFAITQKWAMVRYLSAAQSRAGGYIMRFNGMLFMANRPPHADARTWGTLFCHNNDRIAYIPSLAMGDADIHATFLEYNLQRLPLARARTQRFFGHDGIHFTECKAPIGTPSSKHFDTSCTGASRPAGYPPSEPCYTSGNAFEYGGDGGTPEIGLAALEHYYYTLNETALARYLPLATLAATFYDLHYPVDGAGRLRIFPTGVLEHRWCAWNSSTRSPSENCCANDLPSVAGITHLLEQLLEQLPANATTPAQREAWAAQAAALPPLPNVTDANGTVVLVDAAQLCAPGTNNVEAATQYAVYPYRRFTVARALGAFGGGGGTAGVGAFVKPAVDAFRADPNANSDKSNTDWGQGVFQAALLGLTDDAARLVAERALSPPAPGYWWPGFAPSVHDYSPQTELFAGMAAAVNYMLLAPGDDAAGTIALLPAWPCAWAVNFSLWGPLRTRVSLDYAPARGAAPARRVLAVDPPERVASVLWAGCAP